MKRQHGLLEKIIQWSKSPLVVETVQKSITVGGNTGAAGTADLSKSGHTPVAVVGIQISGDAAGSAEIRQWRLNGNQAYTYVWNNNSAGKTWTMTFHILWLKTLGGGYCIAVFSMLSAISSFVRGWEHEQIVQHSGQYCFAHNNVRHNNIHRLVAIYFMAECVYLSVRWVCVCLQWTWDWLRINSKCSWNWRGIKQQRDYVCPKGHEIICKRLSRRGEVLPLAIASERGCVA